MTRSWWVDSTSIQGLGVFVTLLFTNDKIDRFKTPLKIMSYSSAHFTTIVRKNRKIEPFLSDL